jgi:probable HAF family extracellular repeat protein
MKRFVLSACTVLLVAPLSVAQSYTLTDLGTLNNSNVSLNDSGASAVNDSGQVVGGSYIETDGDAITHAFFVDAGGGHAGPWGRRTG